MGKIQVLVADSQALLGQILAYFLAQHADLDVQAARPLTGPEAVAAAHRLRPDVVVLDYWIKGMEGGGAVAAIRSQLPKTKIVALSWMHISKDVPNAYQAGANEFLSKDVPAHQVVEAIRRAFRGETPTTATQVEGDDLSVHRWQQMRTLTAREIQTLSLLGRGFGLEDVAQSLSVSPLTVKRHVHNILTKTETASQLEVLTLARQYGIIPR